MNNILNFQEIIESANYSKYFILRTTVTSHNHIMSHEAVKDVLKLSDGASAICKARYDLELENAAVEFNKLESGSE